MDYSIKKNINQILFLFNSIWIFVSEYFLYCIFNDHNSFVSKLTKKLASINILYVKVFQAIALNNNFITDDINNQLSQFTDKAPWNYNDIDFDLLINISNDYDLIFKDGFESPINSGMISLVFKAYMRESDEPVIVKIKRVNIEPKLHEAIDNLLYCVDMLSFIPLFKKYNISQSIHKSIDIIEEQTCFHLEVENMKRMKDNCKNLKYIKIPSVYENITNKYNCAILMEYIEGMTINKLLIEDYEEFAKQVMKFGFVTTIIHGFTHGDLHSGNILFIKDINDKEYPYKIGILDFGITYDIDNEYRNVLFQIFSDLFTLSSEEIAEKILLSGIIEPKDIINHLPKKHYDNIIKFTSEIIENTIHCSKQANQKQIYRFLCELYNYLNNNDISKLGLQPSESFIKTQMCLAMAHGVTLKLCKEDSIFIADKVLNELFHMNMFSE